MNNYRKYMDKFETRRYEHETYASSGLKEVIEVRRTYGIYNYNELISLVSKYTGIEEEQLTWEKCMEWLLEEVKEPIKLKRFEYDLISTNDQPKTRKFNSFSTYKHMMDKGYFKGLIGNEDKSLKWILNNSEVEDE